MTEHHPAASETATGPTAEALKKRKRWRRWVVWGPILALVSAVVLAVVVLFVADPGRPLTVGPETTHVTGPVKADGRIDYVKALEGILAEKRKQEGVTPATNAFVPLLQAIGPEEIDGVVGARFYQDLGIRPLPKTGPYLVPLSRDFVKSRSHSTLTIDEVFERQGIATEQPWSRDEFPVIAAWLDANDEPLQHVLEASRREHFYQPLIIDTDSPSPLLYSLTLPSVTRELVRALLARAMLNVSDGQLGSAWTDILAVYRLGDLVGRSNTLLGNVLGSAFEAAAFQPVVVLLNARDLDESFARQMLEDLRDLPAPQSLAESIATFERISIVETLQAFIDGRLDEDDEERSPWESAKRRVMVRMADWDRIARDLNHLFDRRVDGLSDISPKGTAALKRLDAEIEAALKASAPFPTKEPDPPSGATREMQLQFMRRYVYGDGRIAWDRRTTRREVIRAALAVRVHQLDTGRFPERLRDILPAAEIQDRYSGKPLVYRSDENGFVLYSVGENGVDDGGKTYGDGSGADDLVVRVKLNAAGGEDRTD